MISNTSYKKGFIFHLFLGFLLIICLSFVSCCDIHDKITYEYKGVVITRIDECGISSFYYKCKQNEAKGKIWAKYSGINDGFSGYLKFNKDSSVTLLIGDGYFQSECLDSTKFSFKNILEYESPKLSESSCYISFGTLLEKTENSKGNSPVKIVYLNDK